MDKTPKAPLNRRDFFKKGFTKAADATLEDASRRVEKKAKNWIRPPYALGELDFLLACTRCGDCIKACPYDVIFPLHARFGIEVVATPAMDLLQKGCHMCADWPCVTVCEPHALLRPLASKEHDDGTGAPDNVKDLPRGEDKSSPYAANGQKMTPAAQEETSTDKQHQDKSLPPLLAKATINRESCLPYLGPECGACTHSCPIPGALTWNTTKPQINDELCTGCALCREACITSPKSINITPLAVG